MKIGLFGTGAYGIALCSILSHNNHDITMWTKIEKEKEELLTTRCNKEKLPNYKIDAKVKITSDIDNCNTSSICNIFMRRIRTIYKG